MLNQQYNSDGCVSMDFIRSEADRIVNDENTTTQDKTDSFNCCPSCDDLEATEAGPDAAIKDGRYIKFDSAFVMKCLRENVMGDARMFVEIYRGWFIYDHSGQLWYFWDGQYWKVDLTNRVMRAVQRCVKIYLLECNRLSLKINSARVDKKSDSEINRLVQLERSVRVRIQALQTKPRIKDVLELARSGSGPDSLSTDGSEWNRNEWLFCTPYAVIDLRTGEGNQGKPADMQKTCSPVKWLGLNEPDPPIWTKFTNEIFDGDQELISFIQRLVGYFISGKINEEVFIILLGTGRNGKTKFIEAIKGIMGDYSGTMEIETLIEQKNSGSAGGPRSDKLALMGKRFMTCSESEDGHRLSASMVKCLTGGDRICARATFGRFPVEFDPTHKMALLSNFEPKIYSNDPAIRARILEIPFNIFFTDDPKLKHERQKDRDISEKLKAEYSGILSWMVRGCIEWQRIGLQPPDVVRAATEEYLVKNDMLADFIKSCCRLTGETQARIIYDAYSLYCSEAGINSICMNKFTEQMLVKFDRYSKNKKKFYIGISLSSD